jgi:hypothetical protein
VSEPGRPTGDVGLGDLLIREGLAPFEKVHECLEIQKRERQETGEARRLGEILLEKGYLSQTQLGSALELQSRRRESGIPRIPGYMIYEEIGRGAMGTIYRAKQISVGRIVAIKILPPELGTDIAFVQRFLREARSVANLSHPHIVAGIDAGEAEGLHYYVMEHVEGTNAFELVRRHRRLREEEVVRIGLQIARALDHAHRHGIVHRDIKPHNIIVTPDGTAKLCDLGLAKRTLGSDPSLTADGMAIGTPTYLAPEIALGDRRYDARADIYSLGVTLYQLATGNPPFLGVLAADVLRKHVNETPVPPREIVPELSEGFDALVLKMLAKRREDRHQTPADLIRAFEALRAGAAAEPAAAAPPPRKITERRRVTERKITDRKVTERRMTERTARTIHLRRGGRPPPGAGPGVGGMVAAGVAIAFLVGFGVVLAPRGTRPARAPRPVLPDVVIPESPPLVAAVEPETDRHRRRMGEFAAMRDARPWAETWRWLGDRVAEFKGSGFEVLWVRERDRFLESVNEAADAAWARHVEKLDVSREPENLTRALRALMAFPESHRVLQRSEKGVVLTRAGAAYEKLHAELSARRQGVIEPALAGFDEALARGDYDRALTLTDHLIHHILGPEDATRLEGMRRRVFHAATEDALRPPIRPARIAEGKKRLERLYRRYELDLRLFPEMDGALERLDAQYAFALADALDRLAAEYVRSLRERIDRLLASRRYWEARLVFIELLEPGAHPAIQTAIYAAPMANDAALLARLKTGRLLTGREYADAVLEVEAAIAAIRARPELTPVGKLLLDLRALWLLEGVAARAADGLERGSAADFKPLRTPVFKMAKIARIERLPFEPPDRVLAFRIHPPSGSPVEAAIAPASPTAVFSADVGALARLARDPAGDELLDLQAYLYMVFSSDRDPVSMEQLESKLKEDRHVLGWEHYTERLGTIKADKPKEPAAAAPPSPAEKEPEIPAPLFAVPQIPIEGERIRLVYDMSSEKQFEDFKSPRWKVGAPAFEPSKAAGGGMMLGGAGFLYWKATGRGDQSFEIEFDLAKASAVSNFGMIIHSGSRDQGVIAFAGCTQGKYQGRPADGLMGIYRLPLENWEDPLREASRISSEPVKAPLEESGRYVMRLSYSGANRRYEVSLQRQGGKAVALAADLKSRPVERGSVGLWLSDVEIVIRRIVIESGLDAQWVKSERRKTEKD